MALCWPQQVLSALRLCTPKPLYLAERSTLPASNRRILLSIPVVCVPRTISAGLKHDGLARHAHDSANATLSLECHSGRVPLVLEWILQVRCQNTFRCPLKRCPTLTQVAGRGRSLLMPSPAARRPVLQPPGDAGAAGGAACGCGCGGPGVAGPQPQRALRAGDPEAPALQRPAAPASAQPAGERAPYSCGVP